MAIWFAVERILRILPADRALARIGSRQLPPAGQFRHTAGRPGSSWELPNDL